MWSCFRLYGLWRVQWVNGAVGKRSRKLNPKKGNSLEGVNLIRIAFGVRVGYSYVRVVGKYGNVGNFSGLHILKLPYQEFSATGLLFMAPFGSQLQRVHGKSLQRLTAITSLKTKTKPPEPSSNIPSTPPNLSIGFHRMVPLG